MPRRESILLFGEGKTEAVFLNHLRTLYAGRIQARIKVDAGQGGGPRQIASRLIKKHLTIGAYDRSLLLIDEDLPATEIPGSWLRRHKIQVIASTPMCLEGMFLTLLDDPPPQRERKFSKNWKRRFCQCHLGTDRDAEVVYRLKKRCPELFPLELIERQRNTMPALHSLLTFLNA